ncbi:MAG: transglutaminase-like domain-containing protein [Bacteroidales bacterium]|nr:transglutaminase-like domain-containing protein [Bacteroidales bacterium]
MTIDNKIRALLQLLDDPNEEIYMHVSQNIIKQGIEIIPELEKTWETSLNEKLQHRIEDLIQEIQFSTIQNKLTEWKESGAMSILEGAYLIANYQYPDLKLEHIEKLFEVLRKDVWLELNNNLTALEKTRVINHILYEIHQFTGNSSNFYAPQNSYINLVLESKKGNPLTLGIIYIAIAQKLDLPIFGVSMPKNFILAYIDQYNIEFTDENEVLFYINPYNKGAVLGKREIDYFLKQQKLEPLKEYYYPCSNIEIIKKLILNLVYSYEKLGYPEKVEDMQKLYSILNS